MGGAKRAAAGGPRVVELFTRREGDPSARRERSDCDTDGQQCARGVEPQGAKGAGAG